MPSVPIGKQSNDGSRTPTLREFVKSGRALPLHCLVTVVFKPNKTNAYGIVTETGFRVSVNQGSELFSAIDDLLEEWISGNSALVVVPDPKTPGAFSLELETNESAEWKEYDWGYKLSLLERKSTPRSKKKPTDVS